MSNLQYLKKLDCISYYTAPAVEEVTPYRLKENCEIVEILTGGMVYHNHREYRRGTIFWHVYNNQTIYKTRPSEPYRCLVFKFEMTKNTTLTMPKISHWNNLEEMDYFFSQATRFIHAEQFDVPSLSQYLYSRLIWEAVCHINTSSENIENPLPVQRAISFIKKNFYREISLDELAHYARVSKPYLFSLFKIHLKESPHKYINNHRINIARSQLAGSNKAIKAIAFECGFSSITSFYRVFKQIHNISPALYRERNNPYRTV